MTVSRRHKGFTLVELLVAIAVVGMLIAVALPGSARMYQSMQYRQAVREVISTLGSARQLAMDRGRAQDVRFDPVERQMRFGDAVSQLPDGFTLGVTSASEVNRDGAGVIRFYPEGGSSGGDIDITAPSGRGVRISVDWLMGGLSQAAYEDG